MLHMGIYIKEFFVPRQTKYVSLKALTDHGVSSILRGSELSIGQMGS